MNKWKTIGLCMALTGTLSLCAAGAVAGAGEFDGGYEQMVLGSDEEVSDTDLPLEDVVENSMPAMVSITNTSVQDVRNYFGGSGDLFDYFFGGYGFNPYGYGYGGNGGSMQQERVSMGSGVIIGESDDDFLIATNKHVVDGASEISVGFIDESAASAELVGDSKEEDLALIKVKKSDLSNETLEKVKVIPLGSSNDLRVGQTVVAIGNALGYGQSASRGIVSALNRTITTTDDYGQLETSDDLIQTDAAINPGNSGGALLDMSGRLIGINFAKSTRTYSEGVGYAIPIDVAEPILSDIANGKTESSENSEDKENENSEDGAKREASSIEAGSGNAYLGITCVTISDDYARYYGIPTGAYVSEVNPGSAAERAGIAEGDIITKVDGTEITSSSDLKNMISHYSDGDSADLEVITFQTNQGSFGRSTSYERKTVKVTFGVNEDEEKA